MIIYVLGSIRSNENDYSLLGSEAQPAKEPLETGLFFEELHPPLLPYRSKV
jgi:hypothetical protein